MGLRSKHAATPALAAPLNRSVFHAEPWRYSGPRPGVAPRAVLFFHIHKCGGASVVHWLSRHNPAFTVKLDYRLSEIFLGIHHQHFPRFRKLREKWDLPDWQNESIFVEFHSWSLGFYVHDVLPQLQALRAAYRAAGGRLVAFTVLREPRTHITSFYEMWPQYMCATNSSGDRSCGLRPFSSFLRDANGLQTRILGGYHDNKWLPLGGQWRNHSRAHKPFECEPVSDHYPNATERAMKVLRSFDMIGDLGHMDDLARRVAACSGLQLKKNVPHISERHSHLLTAADYTLPALEHAAACDDQLRAAARRLLVASAGGSDCNTLGP